MLFILTCITASVRDSLVLTCITASVRDSLVLTCTTASVRDSLVLTCITASVGDSLVLTCTTASVRDSLVLTGGSVPLPTVCLLVDCWGGREGEGGRGREGEGGEGERREVTNVHWRGGEDGKKGGREDRVVMGRVGGAGCLTHIE